MWLIAWRSRLYSICLLLIIFNFNLTPTTHSGIGGDETSTSHLLEGWAISQMTLHRTGPVLFSHQACPLSQREVKILTTCHWLTIGAWAFLTLYLSAELFPNSGPTAKWLGLLISSHMLVAGLQRERTNWLGLLNQQAKAVLEVQKFTKLMNDDYQSFAFLQSGTQPQPQTAQKENDGEVLVSSQRIQEESVTKSSPSLPSQSTQAVVTYKKEESESVGHSTEAQKQATTTQKVVFDGKVNSRRNSAGEEMVNQLAKLVVNLPIGTNLGMFHFLWMMVTGQLLASRGAIFPALQAVGLEKEAIRRAWAAFSSTSWHTLNLLAIWRKQVISNSQWQELHIQGYRPKAVDLTAFWRPKLANCPTKHYDGHAGKAMPAIVLGIAARVGHTNGQRIPLPELFVRASPNEPSEKELERRLIAKLKEIQSEGEIHIFDAGFDLSMLISLGLENFVIRLPTNFVGRRNKVREYSGRGPHPKYGEQVRPLGRQSTTRWIEADPPDKKITLSDGDVKIEVEWWENLVQNSDKPRAQSFNVYAFHDPRYKEPWLLATDVKELTPKSVRALYKARWPVEQLPLAAKQMLGAHHQFVWSEENMQRLPELSLLAGSILTHVAASLPPIPTGFWDRAPKATPGRLRRHLNLISLDRIIAKSPLPARIRKKESRTDHLKTGHAIRLELEMAARSAPSAISAQIQK